MIKSRKLIIRILRALWIIVLIHNEFFIFWKYANNLSTQLDKDDKNILLIADPQMTDDLSYDRPWLILKLSEFYSELYMKRNYRHFVNSINPYQIFIMGDLMDNGREWDDVFFEKEVKRFNKIFYSQNINYMVGNHDIGFGDGIKPHIQRRFHKYFGQASYVVHQEGYTFFVLDTVSLSSHNPQIGNSALSMLKNYNHTNTILFTHVPLYREPNLSCGPLRQQSHSQSIKDAYGYQYQNMLSKELSEHILNTVKPILIFSADDHDYCEITHNNLIKEITVPTFSMAQGVKYPGLMVLSINDKSLYTRLYWLPSQIDLFIQYAYLLVFTLAILLFFEYCQSKAIRYRNDHELPKTKPIEKNHQHKYVTSFMYNVKDVAYVALLAYIACMTCL